VGVSDQHRLGKEKKGDRSLFSHFARKKGTWKLRKNQPSVCEI